jgi:chromosomal replication initiation ATPase DnaA
MVNYKEKYIKYKKKYILLKINSLNGSGYKCNPSEEILSKFCEEVKEPSDFNTIGECIDGCIEIKRRKKKDSSLVKYIEKKTTCDCVSLPSSYVSKISTSIEHLFKLPNAISEITQKEEKNCITVMQGQIDYTESSNSKYILTTFGLGPCHSLIIYNSSNTKTILSHIDGLSELTILHNIYTYLQIINKSDIMIYITSGQGDENLLLKIYDKLKIINLHDRIFGINIGKGITSVSINSRNGLVTSSLCEGWKSICPKVDMKYKELLKMSGFNIFEEFHEQTWYNTPNLKNTIEKGNLILVHDYPKESENNTFENYIVRNEQHKELFDLSQKFANKVSNQSYINGPYFFSISGPSSVGKTHLSVAISKYVSSYSKNVIFINSKTISDIYQISGGKPMDKIFSEWTQNQDLIIIDDINQIYGISAIFFEKAFKYCLINAKALLITSNIKINKLFHINAPLYFNDKSLLIYNTSISLSYRTPWTENILNLKNPVNDLLQYSGNQGAGIVIEGPNDRVQFALLDINKFNSDLKIRYTKDVFKIQDKAWPTVYDLYVHDAYKYNIVITKVFNSNEAEQLLHLIHNTHNYNLKLIIFIESNDKFRNLINSKIKSYSFEDEIMRLIERINIILPGFNFN